MIIKPMAIYVLACGHLNVHSGSGLRVVRFNYRCYFCEKHTEIGSPQSQWRRKNDK
jgi:hypothetical protein